MTQMSGIAAYAMTSEMAPSTTTFGIVRYAMSKPLRRGRADDSSARTTFAVATTAAGSSTKGPRIPAADR